MTEQELRERIAELEAQLADRDREIEELRSGLDLIESGLHDLDQKIAASLELVA